MKRPAAGADIAVADRAVDPPSPDHVEGGGQGVIDPQAVEKFGSKPLANSTLRIAMPRINPAADRESLHRLTGNGATRRRC